MVYADRERVVHVSDETIWRRRRRPGPTSPTARAGAGWYVRRTRLDLEPGGMDGVPAEARLEASWHG
jgi:hypothetical protein